jgi:energy-coupling factor transporter transmembrane protein EcfT
VTWFHRLDPRTVLFVFPAALTSVFLLSGEIIRDIYFIVFLFAVLVMTGHGKYVLKWTVFLFLLHLPFIFLKSSSEQAFFVALAVRKAAMMLATGMIVMTCISASSCINLMKKMKIDRNFIIPTAICFRFLPTLRHEASMIRDALKARGLYSGKKMACHPIFTAEMFISAFLFRIISLGEELVYSLSTRGLELNGKHFYRNMGVSWRDTVFIAICGLYVLFVLYSPLPDIRPW